MNLRVYLAHKNMKITEFSQKINYNRAYITSILNGVYKPGKKLAKAIEVATEGLVTVKELLLKDHREKTDKIALVAKKAAKKTFRKIPDDMEE